MNKRHIQFILTLLLASLITISIAYWNMNKTKQPDSTSENTTNPTTTVTPSPTIPEYTFETYFVPVAGFKSKKINITKEELSKSTVYITKEMAESIKEIDFLQNASISTLETVEELTTKLNTNLDLVGILDVREATFKLKTLEIEGQFLFDKKTDLSLYPLKYSTTTSAVFKKNPQNYSHDRLIKIGHTGSMIPARGVQFYIERDWQGDYKKLFESTKPLLEKFDHLSSTFEAPVLGEGNYCDSCTQFVGKEKFMEAVEYSGIDFYSMAANHIMDGGVEALANTQELLQEQGIEYTGASTINNDDAGKPVLVNVNGMKIAYLAFNDTPGREQWAMENKPGAASISDWEINFSGETLRYEPNEERIKYFLNRAKELQPDLIFVIMHWGDQEYVAPALDYQKKLGDLLLENGVDVILGDHVHWVQEIEFKDDKPIFYGVGNFIFDQMWSTETRQGMTIEMNYIGKELINIRLHPHQLELPTQGMPVLLQPNDPGYQQTLDRVFEASDIE